MELVTIEEGKELEAFSTKGGLDFILDSVKTTLKKRKPDLSTKKGRDEVASFAHQISKLKVKLDDKGKALTDGWRAQTDLVNSSRKHARDTLEELRDKARQPLTDWEQIDKDRIAKHEENLETLRNMVNVEVETAASYAEVLAETKMIEMGKCWEEFAADAAEAKDEVILFLEREIAAATKREAEAAELEQLRKDAAAREQEEREALIAKQAADRAREEEEAKARELAAKVEADKLEAIRSEEAAKARAEAAERETIAAEERATQAAKEAEERRLGAIEQAKRDEAARIQREAEAEAETQRKREENKRNRNKVKKDILECLIAAGLDTENAQKALDALTGGKIKHIGVIY